MEEKKTDPGALAGAHRADVTMLAGTDDIDISSGNAVELQVRRLLASYAMSLPVALVVAEHAFSSGRTS